MTKQGDPNGAGDGWQPGMVREDTVYISMDGLAGTVIAQTI